MKPSGLWNCGRPFPPRALAETRVCLSRNMFPIGCFWKLAANVIGLRERRNVALPAGNRNWCSSNSASETKEDACCRLNPAWGVDGGGNKAMDDAGRALAVGELRLNPEVREAMETTKERAVSRYGIRWPVAGREQK